MGTRIIRVTRDYWITSDLHRSINRDYKIKRRVVHFLIESTFIRESPDIHKAREKIWKISLPLPKLIRQVWRIDTHDVKTKRNRHGPCITIYSFDSPRHVLLAYVTFYSRGDLSASRGIDPFCSNTVYAGFACFEWLSYVQTTRAINDLGSSGVNDFDSASRQVKDGWSRASIKAPMHDRNRRDSTRPSAS